MTDALNDYGVGRGKLYFDRFLPGTMTGTGERYFGNTPTFAPNVALTSLDHFSSDEGVKELDKSIDLQVDNTYNFSSDNLQLDNIALWFLAQKSVLSIDAATSLTMEVSATYGAFYQLGTTDDTPEGSGFVSNVVATDTVGTKATGTVTVSSQPSDADTLTINGHAITFKTSGAAGAEVNIGGTTSITAASLRALVNANQELYGVSAGGTTTGVALTALVSGTAGNSITLAKSGTNPSVSGATLSGGAAGASITLDGNFEIDLESGRVQILANAPDVDEGELITFTYDIAAQSKTRVVSGGSSVFGALRYIADNATGDNKDHYLPYCKLSPTGDLALKGDEWMTASFTVKALKKTPTTQRVIITPGASQS